MTVVGTGKCPAVACDVCTEQWAPGKLYLHGMTLQVDIGFTEGSVSCLCVCITRPTGLYHITQAAHTTTVHALRSSQPFVRPTCTAHMYCQPVLLPPSACTALRVTVCGADNQTWPNSCKAACANVTAVHEGVCAGGLCVCPDIYTPGECLAPSASGLPLDELGLLNLP